ncbi:MAG TPA: hypothetical protein VH253_00875 [Phycisphaerae bacterium]|nr:hypothetical protein [Phycisphaerae bacterium]
MGLKEQMDSFYKESKWLLERYEKIAKEAQLEAERSKTGIEDPKVEASLHEALVEMSGSMAALARFQQETVVVEDRLRKLEKKVQEEVLKRYAGAAATWDAQRAAGEKLVERMGRLREAAKPLTTRAFKCPQTLPVTIVKSRHPHAAALADEAKRVVELVSSAVYRADVSVRINDLEFGVRHEMSKL